MAILICLSKVIVLEVTWNSCLPIFKSFLGTINILNDMKGTCQWNFHALFRRKQLCCFIVASFAFSCYFFNTWDNLSVTLCLQNYPVGLKLTFKLIFFVFFIYPCSVQKIKISTHIGCCQYAQVIELMLLVFFSLVPFKFQNMFSLLLSSLS